jgi:hypothetical protein
VDLIQYTIKNLFYGVTYLFQYANIVNLRVLNKEIKFDPVTQKAMWTGSTILLMNCPEVEVTEKQKSIS